MEYDYREVMYEDIKEAIENYYDLENVKKMSREEAEEELYNAFWTDDSVTGNGSGSYFFSRYKAEEAICHNLDLLEEAIRDFGRGGDVLESGAEACDVTIRCYLLGQVLSEVLDELEENGFFEENQ